MARIETRAVVNSLTDERPLSFLTVTTRDPDTPLADFTDGVEAVMLRLRRRYKPFDYYGTIEGTTGRYAGDGRRRVHGHYMLKGVPGPEVGVAELLARQTWEKTTLRRRGELGRAWRVTLSEVRSGEAVAAYLASYLGKSEQVLDADWGGRRVRASQRFFPGGRVHSREMARAELVGEARAWRLGYRDDDPAIAIYAELERVNREGVLLDRVARRAELAELSRLMILDYATGRHVSEPPVDDGSLTLFE